MKALRQFFVASVLILTISLSALAGDITTGIAAPQPTPATTEGDMHTMRAGDISTTGADADSVTEAALSLIQSVLSLF